MSESESTQSATPQKTTPVPARNEPCPCGSGKKYKRCHGIDAAPQLTTPKAPAPGMGAGSGGKLPPGVDPSQFDPALVQQMAGMMQRLPRGQLQKLQALMQKAMSGQDVTKEAMELERIMPPEFLKSMEAMRPQLMSQAAAAGMPIPGDEEMSAEEAERIVKEAVQAGRLSEEEAKLALSGAATGSDEGEGKTSRWGKLWSTLKGRK